MYRELLVNDVPRKSLFETFLLEELERLRRMAPATPVYPFVTTRATA